MKGVPGAWAGEPPTGVFPLTNLTEDKDNFYLRAELPGIKAGDVDISIAGNSISVSGKRTIAPEDEKVKYHRREREAGSFRRMINLPGEIAIDKVKAKSTNGVLTVAKEIELENKFENMGAQMVKEVASKTSDVAGDGTTTASLMI